jgi:hypothetical protein
MNYLFSPFSYHIRPATDMVISSLQSLAQRAIKTALRTRYDFFSNEKTTQRICDHMGSRVAFEGLDRAFSDILTECEEHAKSNGHDVRRDKIDYLFNRIGQQMIVVNLTTMGTNSSILRHISVSRQFKNRVYLPDQTISVEQFLTFLSVNTTQYLNQQRVSQLQRATEDAELYYAQCCPQTADLSEWVDSKPKQIGRKFRINTLLEESKDVSRNANVVDLVWRWKLEWSTECQKYKTVQLTPSVYIKESLLTSFFKTLVGLNFAIHGFCHFCGLPCGHYLSTELCADLSFDVGYVYKQIPPITHRVIRHMLSTGLMTVNDFGPQPQIIPQVPTEPVIEVVAFAKKKVTRIKSEVPEIDPDEAEKFRQERKAKEEQARLEKIRAERKAQREREKQAKQARQVKQVKVPKRV